MRSSLSHLMVFLILLLLSLLTANFIILPALLLQIKIPWAFKFLPIIIAQIIWGNQIRWIIKEKKEKMNAFRFHTAFLLVLKKFTKDLIKGVWKLSKNFAIFFLLVTFIMMIVYINHRLVFGS